MIPLLKFGSLLCFVGAALGATIGVALESGLQRRRDWNDLRPLLSPKATISLSTSAAPRWSVYHAPQSGLVVNVATDRDVQVTVKFCTRYNIPFLAQNGANGWSSSFTLGKNGVIIDLRALNQVTFNPQKTQATIGGGAIISEVIDAAYANDVHVLTGNCNCVGALGAALGGGYGYLMGLYGFGVDNILSMNAVLPNGEALTITPKEADLFWAFRGAGPNFGIVTSAVLKSYPILKAQNTAWLGGLFFTEDKIEALVEAIDKLTIGPKMNIFMYYITSGPPTFTPIVLATPFYFGTEAEGRKAFASIFAVGPFNDTTAETPYNQWSDGGDVFCLRGQRKPSYGAGFLRMVPSTWRAIWNEYLKFLENPGTGSSIILLEAYSLAKAQTFSQSSSAFANRDIKFNAVAIAWYTDESLDPKAEAFGSKVRDLWRSTAQLPENRTYVNFAFGDEPNSVVYGESTARLQALRKKYDPKNVFNQWFDI